jgi:hypothetical protein
LVFSCLSAQATGFTKGHGESGFGNAKRDFRGEKRRSDTHSSTTDFGRSTVTQRRLQGAKLCHMDNLMMENRRIPKPRKIADLRHPWLGSQSPLEPLTRRA